MLEQSSKAEAIIRASMCAVIGYALVAVLGRAVAQTETVLYNFGGVRDHDAQYLLYSNGALFGTTYGYRRGRQLCCGDVYELSQSQGVWTFTSLYQFLHDSGGRVPNPGLVDDANGNLYGTTARGGTGHGGTVFELPSSGGKPDFIWDFGNRKHDGGSFPQPGNPVLDSSGSLYGEAGGGRHGFGVVYEISQSGGSWTKTDLYDFKGGKDGAVPYGGLYMDQPGSLWGITESGGGHDDNGTVFHLVQSGGTWTESVIHRFGYGSDGWNPMGALVGDSDGDMYGTTNAGGEFGYGTVYEIVAKKEGGWRERVLYSFCPKSNCRDGDEPFAGLTWGTNHSTLYGTAANGGIFSCGSGSGCGTVFSLTNSGGSWTENVVYRFRGRDYSDGSSPLGPVVIDGSGNIYGTTAAGGDQYEGTVWKITP